MKSRIVNTFLIGFLWLMLSGFTSISSIVESLIVGAIVSLFIGAKEIIRVTPRRVFYLFAFILFLFKELIVSNVKVAGNIFSRKNSLKTMILAVPIELKSKTSLTLLSNLITLTPGTLVIDVSDDMKVIYVHFMEYIEPQKGVALIKNGYERRIKEIFE